MFLMVKQTVLGACLEVAEFFILIGRILGRKLQRSRRRTWQQWPSRYFSSQLASVRNSSPYANEIVLKVKSETELHFLLS
jgi:hypothetical protein